SPALRRRQSASRIPFAQPLRRARYAGAEGHCLHDRCRDGALRLVEPLGGRHQPFHAVDLRRRVADRDARVVEQREGVLLEDHDRRSQLALVAAPSAEMTLLLLGASARWITACARLIATSGSPTYSTARAAASAVRSDCGSASPMSSLARITSRRAMKRASSPASSIRASQYKPASGSEPRIDLMNAEMMS